MARKNVTAKKQVIATERRKRAVAMRKKGMTYAQIGAELQCSGPGAFYLVKHALESIAKLTEKEATVLRQMEVDRLDAAQAAIWDMVLEGDLMAIDRLVKIVEARSRLLGLALEKSDVVGVIGYHVIEAPAEISPENWPYVERNVTPAGLIPEADTLAP